MDSSSGGCVQGRLKQDLLPRCICSQPKLSVSAAREDGNPVFPWMCSFPWNMSGAFPSEDLASSLQAWILEVSIPLEDPSHPLCKTGVCVTQQMA